MNPLQFLFQKKTTLEADVGSFTISVPDSPKQCSQAGRRLFPNAATVSATIARNPAYDMPSTLFVIFELATDATPIITPITYTNEILGPDKGRIFVPANAKNTFVACRKSEKILSKFWANDLDSEQASDSTLKPDTYVDGPQAFLPDSTDAAKYLLQITETSKKGKRGRSKKNKSPKAHSGTKSKSMASADPIETGSDTMNTRSKTHNSSSVPQ